VAYVFIKMANSPRPGVFALERSVDYGKTWKPWQYFADTVSDCHTFFGDVGYENHITSDNSVVCTTDFSSIVPLEGGEVCMFYVLSLINSSLCCISPIHSIFLTVLSLLLCTLVVW